MKITGNRVLILILTTALLALNGCIYSNIKSPLDTDVNETKLGSKVGRASNQSVLWLVGWGDGSTEAAAKDGNITTIKHLDQESLVILFGTYVRVTTIAYGD